MKPRFWERYQEEIVPKIMEQFELPNVMAVPKVQKIVVNRGVGQAIVDGKRVESAMKELALITGQAPKLCKAKKSVSNFKLRQGSSIGCMVTLRRNRMYEFMDRLISVVIPRVRDFRGFPRTSFDGRGNYSMGLTDQVVFPEIRIDDVQYVHGMDITFNIVNSNDEMSLALMSEFGFPFKPAA